MDSSLQQLHDMIASAIQGMTAEELGSRPEGEGSWSAAEVLEHLYLTYSGTVKGCGRCLESGTPLVSPTTLKRRFSKTLVVTAGYFPKGRKSPKQVEPRGIDPAKIASDIGPQIVAMDEMIAKCEAKYGKGPMMDHPILGPLTAEEWRKFHWVHGRHHVKQIERLKRAGR